MDGWTTLIMLNMTRVYFRRKYNIIIANESLPFCYFLEDKNKCFKASYRQGQRDIHAYNGG